MNIRKATLKDIPEMTNLWLDIMKYHEGQNPFFVEHKNAQNLVPIMLEKRLSTDSESAFLAEENGISIGMIMLKIDELPELLPFEKRGYIAETIIKKEYRSKGVGKALVETAKEYFKSENCEVLELQVSSKNPEGIKFWEKLGFEISTHHMVSVL